MSTEQEGFSVVCGSGFVSDPGILGFQDIPQGLACKDEQVHRRGLSGVCGESLI